LGKEKGIPNHSLSQDEKDELMQIVSHSTSEIKQMEWPDKYRDILSFYLIKYKGSKVQDIIDTNNTTN
jgi:hypothetical protein